MTNTLKEEIKEVILSYCEGINHCEFNIEDMDKMMTDIENLKEMKRLEEDALSWSWRHGDDMGK